MNRKPPCSTLNARGRWWNALPLLWLTLGLQTPAAEQANNGIALAAENPPATLATLLIPRETWHPFPTSGDRAFWDGLASEVRTGLVASGEALLTQAFPALPASLQLGYTREGDRGRYEGPYFERRRWLHRLALAECVENQGRFRDALADALWAICEESSWTVPAHLGPQRGGGGLPEIDDPVVDLFAAQTGSSVAWTVYLLGDALDTVSPRLRTRAVSEVDRRILTPYLARDYGWMGFQARSRAARPNNWNPWINGNLITAALLLEPDPSRRVALVHRALDSLDRFLQPYPADGGCDEGPGYWSRAGGSVLDNLDLLHLATGGRLDLFTNPLIREMGRFIHRVHLAGDWYVALGDCAARTGIDRGVVYRYGSRIGDPDLKALAAAGASTRELVAETGGIDLGRSLRLLQDLPAILAQRDGSPPLVRDVWLGSEDLQMMVARDQAGTTRGMTVAAWGAHNAQSHNHNDVGNLVLFADGQPILVDLGAPTYTAKTFSNRRYEIPAMQSDWHNLPTINDTSQSAGLRFAARDVVHRATETDAELSMDLAAAWPAAAGVERWRRTVHLERGRELRLTEDFQLKEPRGGTRLHLITPRTPDLTQPGRVLLPPRADTTPTARTLAIQFDAGHLRVEAEPFALEDRRLESAWGPRMVRIRFTARSPRAEDRWEFRMSLLP